MSARNKFLIILTIILAIASGYSNSAVAFATYTISTGNPTGTNVISLPNGFGSKSTAMNGSTAVVATALQLTTGGTGQAGTAWYPTTVSINGFTTDFDFQLPISAADGFTFTVRSQSIAGTAQTRPSCAHQQSSRWFSTSGGRWRRMSRCAAGGWAGFVN